MCRFCSVVTVCFVLLCHLVTIIIRCWFAVRYCCNACSSIQWGVCCCCCSCCNPLVLICVTCGLRSICKLYFQSDINHCSLDEHACFVCCIRRSLSLVLDEFYSGLHTVGVSALTGEGMDDLFKVGQGSNIMHADLVTPANFLDVTRYLGALHHVCQWLFHVQSLAHVCGVSASLHCCCFQPDKALETTTPLN